MDEVDKAAGVGVKEAAEARAAEARAAEVKAPAPGLNALDDIPAVQSNKDTATNTVAPSPAAASVPGVEVQATVDPAPAAPSPVAGLTLIGADRKDGQAGTLVNTRGSDSAARLLAPCRCHSRVSPRLPLSGISPPRPFAS